MKMACFKNENNSGHTYIQWIVAIIANLITFNYGLQAGWMSPMAKILQSEDNPQGEAISDTTMSWIASTMCMTAVISTPLYSYFADAYGRKRCIISIAIFQALCWIIKILSASTATLILARAVSGIASGGCFCVVPVYTKEISQDNIRGVLGSLVMFFQNVGFVAMYAMGAYLDYDTVLWIVAILPIANVLLLLKAPESPAYLVKIGKIEEARATIALLRGRDKEEKFVSNEIQPMISQDEYFKSLPEMSYRNILSERVYRRGLIVMLLVITVHAASGTFAVLTYASTIMSKSGVTMNPELQTLSFPIVMLLGSTLSVSCIERIRRKTLFIACLIFTAIPQAVLASVILALNCGIATPGWIPVVAIMVSLFCAGAGVMPLPYVIMSEMFNFQVRARLIGLNVTYAWFITFVQLSLFGPVSRALGMHTMFFGFAAINLVGAVLIGLSLPETRGKAIEEIEEELKGGRRK